MVRTGFYDFLTSELHFLELRHAWALPWSCPIAARQLAIADSPCPKDAAECTYLYEESSLTHRRPRVDTRQNRASLGTLRFAEPVTSRHEKRAQIL